MTKQRLLDLAKRHRLRCSFRYTEHFHFQKLRRLFGRAPMHRVPPFRAPVLRLLLCALAARISSITVFIETRQSFRKIKCRWTPTTPAERFGRSCPLPGHGYSVIESLAKGTTSVSPSNRPGASRTARSSISPDPESR